MAADNRITTRTAIVLIFSSGYAKRRNDSGPYGLLLYCEFQKYEVITMSVVGGQPKKHANLS